MSHESGLKPLGRAVLLEYYEPERKESLIALPETVSERTRMLEQRAIVVAIGPSCWPDEEPRAQIGDKVLIARMAGVMVKGPKDGKDYRVVNDRDIFMGIEA